MRKFKFSTKFYLGVIFIILSFVIGKITQFAFFVYFNERFIWWLSIIVYVLSWPLLFIGIWWVGKEYADAIQKYFSYKFYHRYFKNGTKKAVRRGKEIREKVKKKLKKSKK